MIFLFKVLGAQRPRRSLDDPAVDFDYLLDFAAPS
jgi:hypothetical protein